MVKRIIIGRADKTIPGVGGTFVRKGSIDPRDIVDTVNVFFLGPNAALKERNRKIAQRQFEREFKFFGFDIKKGGLNGKKKKS